MLRLWALVLVAVAGWTSFADPVFERGKWSLDDSNPADPNDGVCAASTAANLGDVPFVFSVIVDKPGLRPAEITIRPYTSPSPVGAFRAAVSSRDVYNFAKLPPTEAGDEILWHVPRNTSKFIDYLKAGSQLKVDAVTGTPGTIRFSLSGSSATLKELERRCAANSLYDAKDFEAAFLPAEAQNFDVTLLSPEATSAIREAVKQAVAAYKNVKNAQAAIADLERQFAQLTREKKTLTDALDKLNADRARYQAARDQAQADIDAANAAIAQLQQQIADAQGRLAQAQADLDAANAAIAPVKPEHDRLRGLVRQAQSRLDQARADVDSINQDIGQTTQQIQALQNESQNLRSQLDRVQADLRQAQFDQSDAETAARGFDVQTEIRRARDNNWEYQNLQRNIENLRPQVQQKRQEFRQRTQARDQKQAALNQCQASGAPDCSAQQAELQQAQQAADQAEGELRQLQGQLQQMQQRQDWIDQQIQNDVQNQKARLDQAVNDAVARVRDLTLQRSQVDDRLSNIVRFDLPNAQNHLNDLRGQLPAANAEVGDAQSALARARSAQDAYDQSVNYAALDGAVRAATQALDNLNAQIRDDRRTIEQKQNLIRNRTSTRDQNDQKIARQDQLIAPKQARLNEVNALLAPYDQQKSDIDQQLAAANQLLSDLRAQFAADLPH